MGWIIGWVIGIIISEIIWGCATQAVINNKGYNENWFWWGFFFGFIALIVAATKPQSHSQSTYISEDEHILFRASKDINNQKSLAGGDWECLCGRVNASYIGTCACGREKESVLQHEAMKNESEKQQKQLETENIKLDNLKKYKELLDAGIITQEDFDKKKKEVFG